MTFLYTLPKCSLCEEIRLQLESEGESVRVILIDNPLLQWGIQQLFEDRKTRAPVLFRPGHGVYVFDVSGVGEWTVRKVADLACGVDQPEDRRAHTPEAAGSKPAPATS